MRRPKGAKGRIVTDFLTPVDAFAIIDAAERIDTELALLLKFLLYTGVRLGEALALTWDSVSLEERSARILRSKNEDPRELLLRDDLCEALRSHKKAHGRVFRFHQGGWLKELLVRAKLAACGLSAPARPKKGQKRRLPSYRLAWVNFHSFRHTWASWMRRYGGADLQALVATGNWRDLRSASRYAHAVARDNGNASRARLRSETVENPWTRRNRQPNSLICYVSSSSSPETGRTFFSHPRQHPLHAPQRSLLAGADISAQRATPSWANKRHPAAQDRSVAPSNRNELGRALRSSRRHDRA